MFTGLCSAFSPPAFRRWSSNVADSPSTADLGHWHLVIGVRSFHPWSSELLVSLVVDFGLDQAYSVCSSRGGHVPWREIHFRFQPTKAVSPTSRPAPSQVVIISPFVLHWSALSFASVCRGTLFCLFDKWKDCFIQSEWSVLHFGSCLHRFLTWRDIVLYAVVLIVNRVPQS